MNRRGTLRLYWIFADATAEASVGHVGIMLDDHGGDLTVADPLQGIVTLSKFFVYPSQRGTGLGSASVRFIEDMARTELRARQITLNTLPADIAMDHERFTSRGAKPHQTYPCVIRPEGRLVCR
jgi:GNAT superfamily N-acetyltransferase